MENQQGLVASRRFLTAMAVCFIALPVLVILIPGIHQESSISDMLGRLHKPHPIGEGAAYNNSNAHHLVDDPQPVGQGAALNESNAQILSDDPRPVGQGVALNESNAHNLSDDPHPVGQGAALNGSNAHNLSDDPRPVGQGVAHDDSNAHHLVDDPHPVGEGVDLKESNAHNLSDDPHPVGKGVAHNDNNEHNLSDDGVSAPGFDDKSCLSRFQRRLYKKSERKPSAYLRFKLRSYEHLHRRCGLYTDSYNRTLEVIRSGEDIDITSIGSSTACKYLIWHPVNGLGNRMISLASTFLYALLTNRVLLADLTLDMADLFCEPFMGSHWILPLQFPLRKGSHNGTFRYAHSVGKALKTDTLKVTPPDSPAKAPPFLFLNLYHGADKPSTFYCDESQTFLRRVPCLSLLSDQYFAPSLFLIKSFEKEAIRLFPEKEAVYHHLVHYLMLPSNQAWGLITRFYKANLAKANERIGLQVRVFEDHSIPILTDKILTCLQNQTHLPKIDNKKPELSSSSSSPRNQTSPPPTTTTAILITSLYPQFYQNLSTMYSNKPTVSGEVIKFYQPSHEGKETFGDSEHTMKAFVEIYLLSMCEKLVISADSTFGYAAQGLGASRAWILRRPGYGHRDSCVRDLSIEPCFQWPPLLRSCIGDGNYNNNNGSNRDDDVTENVAYLKHCEDWKSGVKLVDVHEEL